MVYPVNNIKFKIGTKGAESSASDMMPVLDMETFSISIDNGVEEWNPMDQEGWMRRLMTSKSMTIGLNGKRNYGDPGNDYVAGLAYQNGVNANSKLEVEFPNGDKLTMDCVVSVTACAGGDSTNVGVLEFECQSDGKPEYTAAA